MSLNRAKDYSSTKPKGLGVWSLSVRFGLEGFEGLGVRALSVQGSRFRA